MTRKQESQFETDGHDVFLTYLSRNYKRINGFIQMMLADAADVDDLMQETVLILWKKFDTFNPDQSFAAWGIGVARHRIMKLYERQRRDRVMFRPEVLYAIAQHEEVFAKSFDERIQALNKCVEKLNDSDRMILYLRYHKGFSIKNMGVKLQRSAHGLYRSLKRISRMLLQCVRHRLALEQ